MIMRQASLPPPAPACQPTRRERRAAQALVAGTLAVIAAGVVAGRASYAPASRRPDSDLEVIARVPARAWDAAAARREQLRRVLGATPDDLTTAVDLARLDIEAARAGADPRFLGRAEAALAPWWNRADAPPEVLLLRATIRQSRHEFPAALADLDRLTVVAPDDAQGWLTRAVVLNVRGQYRDALASCAALDRRASSFVQAACRAPALALSGRAAEGAAALARELPGAATRAEVAWGRSLLAELALWSGDDAGAEALLRAALALAPGDSYARAALCDRLLDAGRLDEVRALTEGHDADDAILLRRALARAAAGATSDAAIAIMAARFEAARLRGDRVHQREESRFELAVRHDTAAALRLAQENWQVQREPADARVLLEAARAAGAGAGAGAREAARPVLSWLAETGLAWPRLRALAVALAGAS
ncbi:MAG TPA: hypothetical protein VFH68_26325 [Polyangia bacterium]|jgi:hypothetical protein|nr:hypothetical protein [Polyangia bacterium]